MSTIENIQYAVAQAHRTERMMEPVRRIWRDVARIFAEYAPHIAQATAYANKHEQLREPRYSAMQLIEPDFPQIDCDPEPEPVAPRRIGFNR